MKNIIRILGISLLIALYCSAIGMAGGISQNSSFSNKSASEKGKNDNTVSINLLSNTFQAESLANPYSYSLPITHKDSNNEFSAIEKFRELFFDNEFAQYIFIARNFLIKYRKANIIFPSHYFW
ncbi:MAG: hypothetical protein Q7T92_14670 [Lutibacter sp.]|nr:hypothetical protein [Lutibacter sp.]